MKHRMYFRLQGISHGLAFLVKFLLAFIFFISAAMADPMTFSLYYKDYRAAGLDLFQFIYADGEITPGTSDRFNEQIVKWGIIPGGWVYLNSPGGSPIEAMKLGRAIRSAGLYTDVARNPATEGGSQRQGLCASACALAFLGGDFRYLKQGSQIAVHRFYSDKPTGVDGDTAQILSGFIVNYIQEMGVDARFFQMMTLEGRESVFVIPSPILDKLGVTTGDIKSVTWNIQNADGHLYLRVVQIGRQGESKLTFNCGDEGLYAIGYFDTSDPNRVVSEAAFRVWMIDGEPLDFDLNSGALGPMLTGRFVMLGTRISSHILNRILTAERVGLATLPLGRKVFSGFEIRMDADGRGQLLDFTKVCSRMPRRNSAGRVPEVPTSPQPPVMVPAQESASKTPAYAEGRRDRSMWERWFNGLPPGPYRDGAIYWSGERSKPNPGNCESDSGDKAWTTGCSVARSMLAPFDVRRKTEPNYWWGWNSL